MNLLEFEAKEILKKADITIPQGQTIESVGEINVPKAIKSQVPVGGRGKLGGIRVVHTKQKYEETVDELLKLDIKGFIPNTLLVEELLEIDKELYLSLLFDRASTQLLFVASKSGGVEVEDNSDEGFLKVPIPLKPNFDSIGQTIADWLTIADQTFALSDLCEKLFHCFIQNDATLIEINPLVLTKENRLVAADCKITLDDSAGFRHPEWSELSQQPTDVNFVTLNQNGSVATIANGAGLAMATVDAVQDAGLTPANFLDIGGGANEASVLAAFEKIVLVESVKAIIINIFAGITRCDEVARAIIAAKEKIETLPPLFIRLSGTNSDAANQLLDDAEIDRANSLEECIASAQKVVQ